MIHNGKVYMTLQLEIGLTGYLVLDRMAKKENCTPADMAKTMFYDELERKYEAEKDSTIEWFYSQIRRENNDANRKQKSAGLQGVFADNPAVHRGRRHKDL